MHENVGQILGHLKKLPHYPPFLLRAIGRFEVLLVLFLAVHELVQDGRVLGFLSLFQPFLELMPGEVHADAEDLFEGALILLAEMDRAQIMHRLQCLGARYLLHAVLIREIVSSC